MYDDLKPHFKQYIDTSNYSKDNIFGFPLVNGNKLGYMKDEMGGKIIKEFVVLHSKMYSVSVHGGKEIKKAKGVTKCIINKYSIKSTLRDNTLTFKSRLHLIYTTELNKVVLSHSNDKRKILDDGIHTYLLFHKDLGENPEYELDMLLFDVGRLEMEDRIISDTSEVSNVKRRRLNNGNQLLKITKMSNNFTGVGRIADIGIVGTSK